MTTDKSQGLKKKPVKKGDAKLSPAQASAKKQASKREAAEKAYQAEFQKNVNTLLKSDTQAKRLIGVMSLYGRLYYDWTLSNDLIEWRGPIQNLLGTKSKTITGDMFLRKLTLDDYKKRMSALAKCFKDRSSFEIEYHLKLGGWSFLLGSGKCGAFVYERRASCKGFGLHPDTPSGPFHEAKGQRFQG